jgi:hypothetical protein
VSDADCELASSEGWASVSKAELEDVPQLPQAMMHAAPVTDVALPNM